MRSLRTSLNKNVSPPLQKKFKLLNEITFTVIISSQIQIFSCLTMNNEGSGDSLRYHSNLVPKFSIVTDDRNGELQSVRTEN